MKLDRRWARAVPAVIILCLAACSTEPKAPLEPSPYDPLPGTRGYIFLSVDTLRTDHLGIYGSDRETSPFLDALARRGTVFEQAYAHAPATLISHMSMFTGLYPQEHGVVPPSNNMLSEQIPTLPETFLDAGFRTSGHTEGGFMHGAHGFSRGFEDFSDDPFESSTDVEATYERGLEFLRGLGDDDRFFLFLHTYSVHDPYFPPAEYRELFEPNPPASPESVSADHISVVNGGFRAPDPGEVAFLKGQYDAGIRYFDSVLERFVSQVEALGLTDVTWIITSDHGEEFHEHGRFLHTQTYPEALRVPLIVLHPSMNGPRRVADVVRSIDLAPTLWELAGIEAPGRVSGSSLMPYLAGAEYVPERAAYGEVKYLDQQRSWVRWVDGELFLLVEHLPLADADGAWVSRSLSFDHSDSTLKLKVLAFHQPRTLEVVVDDRPVATVEMFSDRWVEQVLELPKAAGARRVELRVDGCVSPLSLGMSDDYRCLGFKVADPQRRLVRLFNLSKDPNAQQDVSKESPRILRKLAQQLEEKVFTPVAEPGQRPLDEEEENALKALGYI